jgi:hypothetical protein
VKKVLIPAGCNMYTRNQLNEIKRRAEKKKKKKKKMSAPLGH